MCFKVDGGQVERPDNTSLIELCLMRSNIQAGRLEQRSASLVVALEVVGSTTNTASSRCL